MASLRQHSAKLIDQALLVSQELVRVAILWQEVWHESLEEASRQYFGDGNVQAMLETLVRTYTPTHRHQVVFPEYTVALFIYSFHKFLSNFHVH
jgi:hypothetical protein